MRHHLSTIVVLSSATLLAACGGGSAEPVVVLEGVLAKVPGEASLSAAHMAGWLTALSKEDWEQRDAYDPLSFAPPSPEDSDPEATGGG